jgi:hypothetical protein
MVNVASTTPTSEVHMKVMLKVIEKIKLKTINVG